MGISGSVGWKGRNYHKDVKLVQQLLQKKGFPNLKDDGVCGRLTILSIRLYQAGFMRRPDGLVSVNALTWRRLSSNQPPTTLASNIPQTVNEHPIAGPLIVNVGQVTFDAEGNDNPKSRNFSRRIHWPGNAASGVTIGRGYDIGNRSKNMAYNHLVRSGVPDLQADLISDGAGKKGEEARLFVQHNADAIGTISHNMQIRLFELIYPTYVERAKSNYNKWTEKYSERTRWDELKKPIKEMLIDFVYQGFTKGEAPMKACMNNNVNELIEYIENSAVMQRYEAGRQRANYLKRNR